MRKIIDGSALYLYDSQSDDAALSGGNWLPSLPLKHLQDPRLERIARSVDVSPASTRFDVVLRRPVETAVIYLGWTNLTELAKARVRFWPDASLTGATDYDSGWVGNLVPADDDPDRGPSLYLMLDQPRLARFITIEIDDSLNFADHIDIGRLIIGRYVKPSFNYSYDGNAFNFVSRAIVASTLSGEEMVWDRAEPRTFTMGFQYLPEDEIFTDFYRMLRTLKRGGEVVVIPRPDAGALELQRRSFLGRAVNRDPIAQAVVRRGHVSLEIREVMGLAPVTGAHGAVILLPVDTLRIRNFAPAAEVYTAIYLPADVHDVEDFEPAIRTAAVVTLPVDWMHIADHAPLAGSGAIVELPADALHVADYGLIVACGASVLVPVDALAVRDFALAAIAGATVRLPADEMAWADFTPSIGEPTLVFVPADSLQVEDFAPAVRTGATVMLSVDVLTVSDFKPRAGGGASMAIPADNLTVEDNPVRIPAFNAGFGAGFA